jgi:tetratricopeptide (TPR) repeat protein
VSVGEAATLVLEVEGTGNVKALPAPPLPVMPGMEIQPPTEDAETDTRGAQIGGIKRFTWVLIPDRPGQVTIPPIEYAFFDPDARRFETARTTPVTFEVTGTVASGASATALAPLAVKASRSIDSVVRSPLFLAAQAVPLLLLLVAMRRRSAPAQAAPRRAERSRPDPFAALRSNTVPPHAFWPRFDAALRTAVAYALNQPALAHAPTSAIATALAKQGTDRATTGTILDLLSETERVRFAQGETSRTSVRDSIERVERAVRAIERGQHGRAAPILLLALAAGSMFGTVPLNAQEARAPFQEGVTLYEQGQFEDAGRAFALHLETNPHDANAWHDLGNAQWSSGERGQAVRAWLRAVRLDPRHAGARANLLTATGNATAALPPRFALTMAQAALVCSVLWWLSLIACAVQAWRRRTMVPAIVAAAVLFSVAGVATLFGFAARDAGVVLQESSLLMAPALKAETIGSLPAGTLLQVVEERDGWTRVRVAGTEGWTESAVIGT